MFRITRFLTTGTAFTVVAALSAPTTGQTPEPMLELLFENPSQQGSVIKLSNTGSLGSALDAEIADPLETGGGLGPGLDGANRGFDNTSATEMGGQGSTIRVHDDDALEGLQSFTLSGWWRSENPAQAETNQPYFASFPNGRVFAGGRMALNIDNEQTTGQGNDWENTTDKWIFFALTVDLTDAQDNVSWHYGFEDSENGLVNNVTVRSFEADPLSAGEWSFGNVWGGARAWQAEIDRVRLWGSFDDGSGAIARDDLNAVFLADQAVIPEPSAGALLAASLGAILMRRRSV